MRRSALTVLALALIASFPIETLGCYRCRKSPDRQFEFCRAGYDRGELNCQESVVDPFNGRTGCGADYPLWDCYNGGTPITDGTGGPGIDEDDPALNGANRPCSWTDVETIRLV